MGFQKITEALVGIHGAVGVIVEVLPVRVIVVGLQDIQCSAARQRRLQLLQYRGEGLLADMLKEVTGKNEIHRRRLEKSEIGHVTDVALDTGYQMCGETIPRIDRDSPLGDDGVDKAAVSCAKFQHAIVSGNSTIEIVSTQRLPNDIASGILREPSLKVRFLRHEGSAIRSTGPGSSGARLSAHARYSRCRLC